MAGHISLDFANTAEWHAGPRPVESLTSFSVAVDWSREAGILSGEDAARVLANAGADPKREARALVRILAVREAVYRIFSAVAHGGGPDAGDLDLLNQELSEGLAHLRLVASPASGGGLGAECAPADASTMPPVSLQFSWAWVGMGDELTSLLWPVARAASTLLTSPQLALVRECAGDPCGWLFLDSSRNASRRWCDMAGCGNRAKARRYRTRRKDGTGPAGY